MNDREADESIWQEIAESLGFDPARTSTLTVWSNPNVEKTDARLALLLALEPGWDGYRGKAIDPETADNVRTLLASTSLPHAVVPSIVPGNAGDVQVEWHAGGFDIEVEVSNADLPHISAWRLGGEVEHKLAVSLEEMQHHNDGGSDHDGED